MIRRRRPRQVGADVVITASPIDAITLRGATVSSLGVNAFLFV